jgi:hypothetical protein
MLSLLRGRLRFCWRAARGPTRPPQTAAKRRSLLLRAAAKPTS